MNLFVSFGKDSIRGMAWFIVMAGALALSMPAMSQMLPQATVLWT